MAAPTPAPTAKYARRRPERTALYEVVRDNLETLYGAIDDGALEVRLGKHAKKELEGYLECGVLGRGFARLRCGECKESRVVAFACKGRGFCPSCTGRRTCATAANLIEHVLPRVALRQWVLTFPFRWRRRLAQDGELLGHLSRIFVSTVAAFYGGKTGAMTVVHPFGYHEARQRTSSDLRLNPHLHVVFLDGAYQGGTTPEDELVWREHGHLQTREVGAVLAKTLRRMHRWLRRGGALQPSADDPSDSDDAEDHLAASAVSGQAPPAGPQWGLPRWTARPWRSKSRSARRSMASPLRGPRSAAPCMARAVRARWTMPDARRSSATSSARRSRRSAHAEARRPHPHHAQARVPRWDHRGGDGSALAPLSPRDERAATSIPYREVRRGTRAGEPVACARRPVEGRRAGDRRERERDQQGPTPPSRLPSLGRVPQAHLRCRRPRLPEVQRAHDPARLRHRAEEHPPAADRARRVGRCPQALAEQRAPYWRSTVLRRRALGHAA